MKAICPDITAKNFREEILKATITCAHCGKQMQMGRGFKDRYPAEDGRFYVICRECHNAEWEAEDNACNP